MSAPLGHNRSEICTHLLCEKPESDPCIYCASIIEYLVQLRKYQYHCIELCEIVSIHDLSAQKKITAASFRNGLQG